MSIKHERKEQCAFNENMLKDRFSLLWLDRSLGFYSAGSVYLTPHAHIFSLDYTKANPTVFPIFFPLCSSYINSHDDMQHLVLFLPFQSNTDLTTCSHKDRERESFCRVILLVILSHRQGWAGATAVCLIACAMGVGSIIRLLRHPAANPASSTPADLISYLKWENSPSDE